MRINSHYLRPTWIGSLIWLQLKKESICGKPAYFLIVYQCLGPPHYLSVFGANRMSTKSRIESTGQYPAGSANNVSLVSTNYPPVTTTTCCHLSSSTIIFVLKSPFLYLVTIFPIFFLFKKKKSFLNLIENDINQKNK